MGIGFHQLQTKLLRRPSLTGEEQEAIAKGVRVHRLVFQGFPVQLTECYFNGAVII